MSKSHHPDLHPNDPEASKRFVRISEAYAVLHAPAKRASYDRDFARAYQQSSRQHGQAYPSGSFSSAAANNPGGRSPSGLSRRRSQFRGPPPSFYRSGGWGAQGAKRAEHAARPSHAWETAGSAEGQANEGESVGAGQGMPGTGPGGFAHGLDDDVPHFDSKGHYQTHSTIERTRHRARRRATRVTGEGEHDTSSGIVLGFFTVSGILLFGVGISGGFGRSSQTTKASRGDEKDAPA